MGQQQHQWPWHWQWQRRRQHPDALLGSALRALRATHKTTTTSAFLPGTGPGPLAFWDWFRFWFVWGVANGPQSHALPLCRSRSRCSSSCCRCCCYAAARFSLQPCNCLPSTLCANVVCHPVKPTFWVLHVRFFSAPTTATAAAAAAAAALPTARLVCN